VKAIYSTFGLFWLCAAASAADTAFLKDAADGGLFEIKLGELAQSNASSQFVKDFGQKMITEHGAMNQEVQNLAGKQNITLPSDIALKEKMTYEILAKKKGADFDKAYMEDMVKDHEADLGAFQREADSGSDSEAKALAAKAIPVIREHLHMAQQIASQLK
jgi:putative membrane protein